jgi:hypothetical protein
MFCFAPGFPGSTSLHRNFYFGGVSKVFLGGVMGESKWLIAKNSK